AHIECGRAHGGRGIPAHRFEKKFQRGTVPTARAEFIPSQEEVVPVCDREYTIALGTAQRATQRLREQALSVGELDERLGQRLAGDRPKTRPRAARKDYRNKMSHGTRLWG